MRKISLTLATLAITASALTACGEVQTFKLVTGTMTAAMYDVFRSEDVNLKAKNHAAADFLESRMKGYVGKADPIRILPLVQSDNASMSSPLGRNIPEGIGVRLNELGYHVKLSESLSGQPQTLNGSQDKYSLGGTYLRGKKNVDIHLKVIETASGKLITNFDYQLPLTREIKELSNTETRIFRVQQ